LKRWKLRVEASHHLARLGFHGRIVERAPPGHHFPAEEKVGGGVDIVGQGKRLVDRLDAILLGVARIGDRHRLAIDQDLAGIALVGAGEDLDQVDLPAPL
jgi:hypothetical protein